jgi:WD40 repeat protein
MTCEPDLASLPVVIPERVTWLIRRCLQKDPRRRLRDIGDALAEVEAASASPPPPHATTLTTTSRAVRALPWAVAAAGVVFALATLLVARDPSPTVSQLVQVEAKVGQDVSLFTDQGPAVVMSPDGSSLAFIGRKTGVIRQLYVRRLDQLEAILLAGTEDALGPFFSPDGDWIAFFAGGKLKKVPVSGGPVVVLCDAPSGRGGSWGDNGWIVFTPNASGNATLQRVSENGGATEQLTTLRVGEASQRWPQVLPGGRSVIYSTTPNLSSYDDGEIVVKPLPDGDQKVILKGGFFGRYWRSDRHLDLRLGSRCAEATHVRFGRRLDAPLDARWRTACVPLEPPSVCVQPSLAACRWRWGRLQVRRYHFSTPWPRRPAQPSHLMDSGSPTSRTNRAAAGYTSDRIQDRADNGWSHRRAATLSGHTLDGSCCTSVRTNA